MIRLAKHRLNSFDAIRVAWLTIKKKIKKYTQINALSPNTHFNKMLLCI